MNVLILGANGFIGSHLSEAILKQTDWHVYAMDLHSDKLGDCLTQKHFHFQQGDIREQQSWIDAHIQKCDVVLPLVAIATPALYVQDPLRVFGLDFEANLAIIRQCVTHQTRIIFPSTSEVYGMCPDPVFDEETSPLVTGPIAKERWIYATSKQLLDRLIFAYGKHHGLSYCLFRPFNWYGPKLDDVHNPKPGASRVLTQFIGNIIRGEKIQLVNGGAQQRCFTYVSDGIDALLKIIENKDKKAENQIFNIGNPDENYSIRTLAETILKTISIHFPQYSAKLRSVELVDIQSETYYGAGYQDVSLRVPSIKRAQNVLNWQPKISLDEGVHNSLVYYLK